MAYLVDLQDKYVNKSIDELADIIRKDYALMEKGSGNNLALSAVMVAFNKFVYNTDFVVSQKEHQLYNAVLPHKSYEDFKKCVENPDLNDLTRKVFNAILRSNSMQAKCALLEMCICICACDGNSIFEWMELNDTFPSDVIENFEKYI